jgi:hypothetical protein
VKEAKKEEEITKEKKEDYIPIGTRLKVYLN